MQTGVTKNAFLTYLTEQKLVTKYDLLIFDIDGTICLTKDEGDKCFTDVFEELYNVSLADINWENFPNVTDTALYDDLYNTHFNCYPDEKEKH